MNFSPVLDHVTNEQSFLFTRAFRGEKESVARLAVSMINGYQDAGIVSSVKHFPGHSNESLESHSALDMVNIQKEELGDYIYPFKQALSVSQAVMLGHILFPNIDSESPDSVYKYFVNYLLREELEYDGLIIADDMQMKFYFMICTVLGRQLVKQFLLK